MYCTKCGNQLGDGASFCGKCGSQVGASAAPTAAAPSPGAPDAAVGSPAPRGRRKLVAVLIAAVLVVAIVAVAAGWVLRPGAGPNLGQTTETVQSAFEAQESFEPYLPSDEYVESSPYGIASFDVADMEVHDNGSLWARVNTAVENESFKVDLEYKLVYRPYSDTSNRPEGKTGTYEFRLLSKKVTPKKGIDKDEENGFSAEDVEFDAETGTCRATTVETFDLWFADAQTTTTVTYAVDEDGWHIEDESTVRSATYKNINGDYHATMGNQIKIGRFTISDLDAEAGTFTISYQLNSFVEGLATAYEKATGTMSAVIMPNETGPGETLSNDSFYFVAEGTSDSGEGHASMSGFLEQNESGASRVIDAREMRIDTLAGSAFYGSEHHDATYELSVDLYQDQ